MFLRICLARPVIYRPFATPTMGVARSFASDYSETRPNPYINDSHRPQPPQFDTPRRPHDDNRPSRFLDRENWSDNDRSTRRLVGELRSSEERQMRRVEHRGGNQFDEMLEELNHNARLENNDGWGNPMLLRFRDLIASKKAFVAWRLYERLMKINPNALTLTDHLNYLSILRYSKMKSDFAAMEAIFKVLEDGGFEISVPVYDAVIQQARTISVEATEKYFDKMVQKHGRLSHTVSTFAARMNAYRVHEKNYQKVIELANEAESLGIHTHRLKPIIMDAFYKLGDEAAAQDLFDSYLARERGTINIAKIYGWMAQTRFDAGKIDEARAALITLVAQGITPSHNVSIVQIRLAIHDKDLVRAREILKELINYSRYEVFTHVSGVLVDAHLAAGDLDGLEQFLEVYNKKHAEIPNLRFLPYLKVMEYHAKLNNPGARGTEEVKRVFEMIPSERKHVNVVVLRTAISAFAELGDMERARDFVSKAYDAGFSTADLHIDPAIMDKLSAHVAGAGKSETVICDAPATPLCSEPTVAPIATVDPSLLVDAEKPLRAPA